MIPDEAHSTVWCFL